MAGYIGSKAVNLSTTGADINGDANIDGDLSFRDNDKAIFGAGSDLQIYHSGSDSWIEDNGTGNLYIDTNGAGINISYNNSAENMATFTANGAATLYYDNAAKLATTSTGVDITGTLTSDNAALGNFVYAGESGGLYLDGGYSTRITSSNYGAANQAMLFYTGTGSGTERMRLDNSGRLGIGTSSPSGSGLHIRKDTSATTNELLRLSNSAGSTTDGVKLVMEVANTSGNGGEIGTVRDGGSFNPYMYFSTSAGVGSSPSERMRIDSSGNVGIGTTTPNAKITLKRSGAGLLANGDDGTVVALIADTTGSVLTYGTYTSHPVTFKTANGERMRIDSSGNVGIGTTAQEPSVSNDDSGFSVRPVGTASISRTGGPSLDLNRKSSDGYIAVFRKDGSTVGSISSRAGTSIDVNSESGDLHLQRGGTTGLVVNPTYSIPGSDAGASLGISAQRWSDLYLSGGVYLGGTGSANKLEDYEEGNWTPAITFGGNNAGQAYSSQGGRYVKIGNLVHVTAHLSFTNKGTSTGSARLTGLPHNIQSTNNNAAFTPIADRGQLNASGGGVAIFLQNNVSTPTLYTYSFTGGGIANLLDTAFANNTEIDVNFSYLTT